MAASLCSPLQIRVPNWCAERHRVKENCEARLGAVRSKRLGDGVWRGLEAERSLHMASLEGKFRLGASSSASTSPALEAAERQNEAAEMVQEFYAAINRREIASIGDLFADDCVYEDLVFPKPFVGRKVMPVVQF